MTDSEKIAVYETAIYNIMEMLISERDELQAKFDAAGLSEFENGRYLAYKEMIDTIETNHSYIMDVIE